MKSLRRTISLIVLVLGSGATIVLGSIQTSERDAFAAKIRKKPRALPTAASNRPTHDTRADTYRTHLYDVCPTDMVNVRDAFCIDRWEASVVDVTTGLRASPYYPPHAGLAFKQHVRWAAAYLVELEEARTWMIEAGVTPHESMGALGADPLQWLGSFDAGPSGFGSTETRAADAGTADAESAVTEPADASIGNAVSDVGVVDATCSATCMRGIDPLTMLPSPEAPHGWILLGGFPDGGDGDQKVRRRAVMLPPMLLSFQSDEAFRPRAVSEPGVVPQGYTPGFVADRACREAGKRLCREDEWVLACKGEKGTKFPYGSTYQHGRCNVFRQGHPGMVLHGNWSVGLSDPRLNMVRGDDGPMLRTTGETKSCGSAWGDDVIWDMVGNLDEWVDDPGGVFVGGFYSRATRNGCEARVSAHPIVYFDYSTGFRCCADLSGDR